MKIKLSLIFAAITSLAVLFGCGGGGGGGKALPEKRLPKIP